MAFYSNSLHRSGYTRSYALGTNGVGNSEWHVVWDNEARPDAKTHTPLAPGAMRNWASASDTDYAQKERAHARLLAVHEAGREVALMALNGQKTKEWGDA